MSRLTNKWPVQFLSEEVSTLRYCEGHDHIHPQDIKQPAGPCCNKITPLSYLLRNLSSVRQNDAPAVQHRHGQRLLLPATRRHRVSHLPAVKQAHRPRTQGHHYYAFSRRRKGVRYLTNGLKVYHVPFLVIYRQATFPTVFSFFPILRYIFIRERIEIVHGHGSLSCLCHEGILHAGPWV